MKRTSCLYVSAGFHDIKGVVICLRNATACSFRWFIVAESTVRWFVVREKHCWMTADSAE
jgi:hypothetical protein